MAFLTTVFSIWQEAFWSISWDSYTKGTAIYLLHSKSKLSALTSGQITNKIGQLSCQCVHN